MLRNTEKSYGVIARMFHWLMALMILALIPVGWYMAEYEVYDLYPYHKAIGMLVLFLGVLRLMWTLTSVHPHLPDQMIGLERIATYVGHFVLYVLILLIPITGYVFSSSGGYEISIFGLVDIPLLIEKNEELHKLAGEVHMLIAFGGLAVIVGHILAAYKHHFINKDNTMLKMTRGVE